MDPALQDLLLMTGARHWAIDKDGLVGVHRNERVYWYRLIPEAGYTLVGQTDEFPKGLEVHFTPRRELENPGEDPEPERSRGHLGFVGDQEYFKDAQGEVWRAPVVAPMGPTGYRKKGKFEASRSRWEDRRQLLGLNPQRLDEFTETYIQTALWSSMDESTPSGGEPMDKNYSISDIDPETISEMAEDCRRFQSENWNMIQSNPAKAGYHFWLTRNGHGAGFWDGDWPEYGEALTEASRRFGEYHLYVGDDGKIHGTKG